MATKNNSNSPPGGKKVSHRDIHAQSWKQGIQSSWKVREKKSTLGKDYSLGFARFTPLGALHVARRYYCHLSCSHRSYIEHCRNRQEGNIAVMFCTYPATSPSIQNTRGTGMQRQKAERVKRNWTITTMWSWCGDSLSSCSITVTPLFRGWERRRSM